MKVNPKKQVKEMVQRLGKAETLRLLIVAGGISPHTAEKLVGGRYPSEVGNLVGQAIRRAQEASLKAS